jgi:hypothetical protein
MVSSDLVATFLRASLDIGPSAGAAQEKSNGMGVPGRKMKFSENRYDEKGMRAGGLTATALN